MSPELELLADKADEIARAFTAQRTIDEARALLNEAGMNRARQRLHDALAHIETAQGLLREQQEVVGQAKTALEQAVAEVEWELDAKFVADGNKTFLVDGDVRKAMTADERTKWKAQAASKNPRVAELAQRLRAAEADLNACRDAADHSRLAYSAAKHDLDSACVTAQVLAQSLRKGTDQ